MNLHQQIDVCLVRLAILAVRGQPKSTAWNEQNLRHRELIHAYMLEHGAKLLKAGRTGEATNPYVNWQ